LQVAVFARQYIINTNSAQTVNTVISNLIQYVTQQAGFCETINFDVVKATAISLN